MKQRLADYIADFLASHGVTDIFTVVGGGAMHLNDALGHHPKLRCTYFHHEQAAAMAADSYARLENKIAVLCVTTGPGGTNALTGIVGGWLDSIPMFVVSGQVRYDTTARYGSRFTEGFPLRSVGDQEYDITQAAQAMTKYAVMLEKKESVRYHLERAWNLAYSGRPGPVWLDIPVDYQGAEIETDDLEGYDPEEDMTEMPPEIGKDTADRVLDMIMAAERPVIYGGGGIRISGGYGIFRKLIEKLGVPVITYWNTIDLIETEHPLYCGRAGNMGDRPGNFAVQNSDLVLALGTRLSIRQTGYDYRSWARAAKVIMVNIDRAEMKKHTLHIDMPVWADVKDFMAKLYARADERFADTVSGRQNWREQCLIWKKKYPVLQPKHISGYHFHANIYAALHTVSESLPENSLTAVSNGACCVAGHQTWVVRKGSRFINNNAIASMGYGLPAAIGLCIAGGKRDTVCMEGDGSIMMNLQELQTIVTNRLPVKIFLINNDGYQSIRITQNNIFAGRTKVGIGPDSGDLSFPDFRKIAAAFGYPYYCVRANDELKQTVEKALDTPGFVICEIFTDTEQVWEPKSSSKRLPDGRMVSSPLEDLAPFLSRDELKEQMYIPLVEE